MISKAIETENAPKGMGVYIRRLGKVHGTPRELAGRLDDAKIRHAHFLVCWHDGKGFQVINKGKIRPYAEEFAKRGIKVGLWGFPRPDGVRQYIDAFVEASQDCNGLVHTWLHDPELPWKEKGAKQISRSLRGQGEAVEMDALGPKEWLVDRAEVLMQADMLARQYVNVPDVGITSYGMADWHPIPYKVFAQYGWSSPQLYSVTPAMVDRGLMSWKAKGSEVFLPSIPVFGKNSSRKLEGHLNAFVDHGTPVKIQGMVIWSYRQMSNLEERTLAQFSERMEW